MITPFSYCILNVACAIKCQLEILHCDTCDNVKENKEGKKNGEKGENCVFRGETPQGEKESRKAVKTYSVKEITTLRLLNFY